MKGLIYREFYLSRKPAAYMLLSYVLFTGMIAMVIISTYAGNLAKDANAAETREYIYSQMYIYIGLIGFIGAVYGHNDLIEKDYKSKWQLYSYTLPVNEKKIIASKFIVRGSLLFAGFLLAVLGEVILSSAAKKPFSISHFKNILLIILLYGPICIGDIPLMLKMKTQAKAAAVALSVGAPLMAAAMYGVYKFVKFCIIEGRRLYPDLDSDAAMTKAAMPYITKWRDIALVIAPFFFVAVIAICYFWAVKELKRRRY
ncbi:ABC-2 transporter permease [Ruminococcus flavefaciens]|uniref:ABC-2 transporter permease n=1 Tax=Ruminococcus flavefaciens TaxID=1265 RepID=UPI0004644EBC|nr:ABC-2 transporter permease [Ruminococcus flavefaciens]